MADDLAVQIRSNLHDKDFVQGVLDKLGVSGLEVRDLDGDRAYCLTKTKVYHGEETGWIQEARTVVFEFFAGSDGGVHVNHEVLHGWVVPE